MFAFQRKIFKIYGNFVPCENILEKMTDLILWLDFRFLQKLKCSDIKKGDIFWRFTKNRVLVYQDFTNWNLIKACFRKPLMKDQYLKRIY